MWYLIVASTVGNLQFHTYQNCQNRGMMKCNRSRFAEKWVETNNCTRHCCTKRENKGRMSNHLSDFGM